MNIKLSGIWVSDHDQKWHDEDNNPLAYWGFCTPGFDPARLCEDKAVYSLSTDHTGVSLAACKDHVVEAMVNIKRADLDTRYHMKWCAFDIEGRCDTHGKACNASAQYQRFLTRSMVWPKDFRSRYLRKAG